MEPLLKWLCKEFFWRQQWARRYVGGRWELWYNDVCCSTWWLRGYDSRKQGRPYPCMGSPMRIEDYDR